MNKLLTYIGGAATFLLGCICIFTGGSYKNTNYDPFTPQAFVHGTILICFGAGIIWAGNKYYNL